MPDLTYELLDSGDNRKLERFGEVVVDRPRGQAVWQPLCPKSTWSRAEALFVREGKYEWEFRRKPPKPWVVEIEGVKFGLEPTDFGHVGVFPEHGRAWRWMAERIRAADRQLNVLNLFAYTGGGSFVAARAGARVCHLDASKKSVQWARDNAALNDLTDAPIRWITDDVLKFLAREQRRGVQYDGIILDPPNFGRGTRQEVFKLDEQIGELLGACRAVLSAQPAFVVLTCHAQAYTPIALGHLVGQMMSGFTGNVATGEMILEGRDGVLALPSGSYAAWETA